MAVGGETSHTSAVTCLSGCPAQSAYLLRREESLKQAKPGWRIDQHTFKRLKNPKTEDRQSPQRTQQQKPIVDQKFWKNVLQTGLAPKLALRGC